MNAKEWRAAGFKTVFRGGRVYLVAPRVGHVVSTPVDSGLWMERTSDDPRWRAETALPPDLALDIRRTIAACYCDQGVDLCDFCGRIRPAPIAI